MYKPKKAVFVIALLMSSLTQADDLIPKTALRSHVEKLNEQDVEHYKNTIPNSESLKFLADHIPLFECPDKAMERTYYFRWWTFRKHLRKTEDGWVITEFLPHMPYVGKHNTIVCPAAHQLREGRWLRDSTIARDYLGFLLNVPGAKAHNYSFWPAVSALDIHQVHPDEAWLKSLLPGLVKHHNGWNGLRTSPKGLYAQADMKDGMEATVGGLLVSNPQRFHFKVLMARPSFNSYMYGDAKALAEIAKMAGDDGMREHYQSRADLMKRLVQERLWNPDLAFFTCLPRNHDSNTRPINVREQVGFIPWYFFLPDEGKGYEKAWSQLMDPKGFHAPFGPTTVEQRSPHFVVDYGKFPWDCQWNGPSWPFATSQTLVALANLLNAYQQDVIDAKAYWETLQIYTKSHAFRQIPPEGAKDGVEKIVKEDLPWIDENLDPYTGNWLTRYRLHAKPVEWAKRPERGKDYNHSTYCDLIINGLVGLRPETGGRVVLNPLIPEGEWDWFCLEKVPCHGQILTVFWDRDGSKYGRGKGLQVIRNNQVIASRPDLGKLEFDLSE